jgi:hypothetical protein
MLRWRKKTGKNILSSHLYKKLAIIIGIEKAFFLCARESERVHVKKLYLSTFFHFLRTKKLCYWVILSTKIMSYTSSYILVRKSSEMWWENISISIYIVEESERDKCVRNVMIRLCHRARKTHTEQRKEKKARKKNKNHKKWCAKLRHTEIWDLCVMYFIYIIHFFCVCRKKSNRVKSKSTTES